MVDGIPVDLMRFSNSLRRWLPSNSPEGFKRKTDKAVMKFTGASCSHQSGRSSRPEEQEKLVAAPEAPPPSIEGFKAFRSVSWSLRGR